VLRLRCSQRPGAGLLLSSPGIAGSLAVRAERPAWSDRRRHTSHRRRLALPPRRKIQLTPFNSYPCGALSRATEAGVATTSERAESASQAARCDSCTEAWPSVDGEVADDKYCGSVAIRILLAASGGRYRVHRRRADAVPTRAASISPRPTERCQVGDAERARLSARHCQLQRTGCRLLPSRRP